MKIWRILEELIVFARSPTGKEPNPIAMASNLEAMTSNLIAMASNLIAMNQFPCFPPDQTSRAILLSDLRKLFVLLEPHPFGIPFSPRTFQVCRIVTNVSRMSTDFLQFVSTR